MPTSMTTADAGRLGSTKRWKDHVPVRVHMGDLTPAQRRVILAMIEAEREKVQKAAAA